MVKKFHRKVPQRLKDKKKRTTHKDCSKEPEGFNRCLEIRNCMSFALQKDFHQQIKDLLRSLEPELCCDTPRGTSAFSLVLFSFILEALGSL